MLARGYKKEFAKQIYQQIQGFGEYGFPESHAASFALLVYVSSWLKCHHPDAFACGLLNSQPMGFYAPAQIVSDARKNGVEVRAIDVSHSFADNTLEQQNADYRALRLGFRQIDGFVYVDPDEYVDPADNDKKPRDDWGKRIVEARAQRPFDSLEDFVRATDL